MNSTLNELINIIIEDSKKVLANTNFSSFKNKSILLTGASGLIGTYLLASLYNILTSTNLKLKVNIAIHSDLPEFLRPLTELLKCRVYQGDITSRDFCKSLPKVDFIIHGAGYGQPGKFMEDPIKTLQINTTSTLDLFEHLSKEGSLLFLSSSEVYSGLTKGSFKESQIGNTITTHPRACYIEGKRTGETICNEYRKLGINAKSARVSLVYGPGTRPKDARVLNNFIEKALTFGKIELLDQGEAKRTYCYVTDAVEMLWDILLFGRDAIYNVGGESRTTIKGLAKLIAKEIGVPVYFPEKSNDLVGAPDDVYLDLTKLKSEFKKTKFVSLRDGIKNTINWQRFLCNEKT